MHTNPAINFLQFQFYIGSTPNVLGILFPITFKDKLEYVKLSIYLLQTRIISTSLPGPFLP